MINRETEVRPDGAIWRRYLIDKGEVVLTSRGRELFHNNPELWRDIHAYRNKLLGKVALGESSTREFFAKGTNARLYKLNDTLLVKEAALNGMNMPLALKRMDTIQSVIENGAPRWIDMPVHYGLLATQKLDRQYVLMDRVDAGITVEHIAAPEELSEVERRGLHSEFGAVSLDDQAEVADRYEQLKQILDQSLADADLVPSDYLTDWHMGNVVVERLQTPIAGSNFKMWVIDQ